MIYSYFIKNPVCIYDGSLDYHLYPLRVIFIRVTVVTLRTRQKHQFDFSLLLSLNILCIPCCCCCCFFPRCSDGQRALCQILQLPTSADAPHLSYGVTIVLLHGGGGQHPAASEQVSVELHRRLDQLGPSER